jgi:Acyl-CoA dehydrogenase, N-terminal domain
VEPQADAYNKAEKFNKQLFQKLGTLQPDGLGLLGLTVPEEYDGGCGMDATAVALVHEELSYSDPALCLSYLAHSILLVHNLAMNATCTTQLQRLLPDIIAGRKIGGMGMSEANSGTDVLGMKTVATRVADGTPGGGTLLFCTVLCVASFSRRLASIFSSCITMQFAALRTCLLLSFFLSFFYNRILFEWNQNVDHQRYLGQWRSGSRRAV